MDFLEPLFKLNSIGLLLDLFGVILVWKFDIPRMSKSESKGEQGLLLEQEDEEAKRTGYWHRKFSQLGMFLIALGFLLQFLYVVN